MVLSNSGKRSAANEARLATLGFDRATWTLFLSSGEVAWRMLAAQARERAPEALPRPVARRRRLADRGPRHRRDRRPREAADLVLIAGSEAPAAHARGLSQALLAPAADRARSGALRQSRRDHARARRQGVRRRPDRPALRGARRSRHLDRQAPSGDLSRGLRDGRRRAARSASAIPSSTMSSARRESAPTRRSSSAAFMPARIRSRSTPVTAHAPTMCWSASRGERGRADLSPPHPLERPRLLGQRDLGRQPLHRGGAVEAMAVGAAGRT